MRIRVNQPYFCIIIFFLFVLLCRAFVTLKIPRRFARDAGLRVSPGEVPTVFRSRLV